MHILDALRSAIRMSASRSGRLSFDDASALADEVASTEAMTSTMASFDAMKSSDVRHAVNEAHTSMARIEAGTDQLREALLRLVNGQRVAERLIALVNLEGTEPVADRIIALLREARDRAALRLPQVEKASRTKFVAMWAPVSEANVEVVEMEILMLDSIITYTEMSLRDRITLPLDEGLADDFLG